MRKGHGKRKSRILEYHSMDANMGSGIPRTGTSDRLRQIPVQALLKLIIPSSGAPKRNLPKPAYLLETPVPISASMNGIQRMRHFLEPVIDGRGCTRTRKGLGFPPTRTRKEGRALEDCFLAFALRAFWSPGVV